MKKGHEASTGSESSQQRRKDKAKLEYGNKRKTVEAYHRILGRKSYAKAETAESMKASSFKDSILGLFSKQSLEERVIRSLLKNYKIKLQNELQTVLKATSKHKRRLGEQAMEFDKQEKQLIVWGLKYVVPHFRMQAWARLSRSGLMKEMSQELETFLVRRIARVTTYMMHFEDSVNRAQKFSVQATEEFCQAPETLMDSDIELMVKARRLYQLDGICSVTTRKFMQFEPECRVQESSQRRKVLLRILYRYKSLSSVQSLGNIESPDLSWEQFCDWLADRNQGRTSLEQQFSDFVEDQREKEGRLFYRWYTSVLLPYSRAQQERRRDVNARQMSQNLSVDASVAAAVGKAPPSSFYNSNSNATPSSTDSPLANAPGIVALKVTPHSIRAFIRYFAHDVLGVQYGLPRDVVEANLALTEALFYSRIHSHVFRYREESLRKKDYKWRLQCIKGRFLDPAIYHVPPKYRGAPHDPGKKSPEIATVAPAETRGSEVSIDSYSPEEERLIAEQCEALKEKQKIEEPSINRETTVVTASEIPSEEVNNDSPQRKESGVEQESNLEGKRTVSAEKRETPHNTGMSQPEDYLRLSAVSFSVGATEKQKQEEDFYLATENDLPRLTFTRSVDKRSTASSFLSREMSYFDRESDGKEAAAHSREILESEFPPSPRDIDKLVGVSEDKVSPGAEREAVASPENRKLEETEHASRKDKVALKAERAAAAAKFTAGCRCRVCSRYTASRRLQQLREVLPGQYGASYARAARVMSLVTTASTPREIIFLLSLAGKWLLRDAIDVSSSRDIIGADLLIPLFTLVLLNAQLPCLHLVLQVLLEYGEYEEQGDVSYTIANLEGSLLFIMGLDLSHVECDTPEYQSVLAATRPPPPQQERKKETFSERTATDLNKVQESMTAAAEAATDTTRVHFESSFIYQPTNTQFKQQQGAGAQTVEAQEKSNIGNEESRQGSRRGTHHTGREETEAGSSPGSRVGSTSRDNYSNDVLAMEQLGEWLRDQQTMEDTITILQKEGWMA